MKRKLSNILKIAKGTRLTKRDLLRYMINHYDFGSSKDRYLAIRAKEFVDWCEKELPLSPEGLQPDLACFVSMVKTKFKLEGVKPNE